MIIQTKNTKNPTFGIFAGIISFLCFALLSGFVKAVSHEGLATEEILFFQSVIALVVLVPWIFRQGGQAAIPRNKTLIVIRSFIGLTFLYLFYMAVRSVPLVNAVLLQNTSPLFIPILTFFLLKKRLTAQIMATMMIGFIGVVLVLNPGRGFLRPGDLIALSAGLVSALGTIAVGRLEDKGESVPTMMLYYLMITMVVTGIWAIQAWKSPQGVQWFYLVFIGILYAAYQVLFLTAIKYASPVIIAPFIYLGVVFSGVVDWIGWKQVPDHMTIIGAIVVVAGAVFSAVHHAKNT